ncbi:hypothetical protein ANO14919_019790 [Xylariales sp. No.14919]|nr:hypothetical protein ANO14919_019790 [Xylariales sp. No.14919]
MMGRPAVCAVQIRSAIVGSLTCTSGIGVSATSALREMARLVVSNSRIATCERP